MRYRKGRKGKGLPVINNWVVAGMATMPSRKESCLDAVTTLIKQVDSLMVYVNTPDGDLSMYEEDIWKKTPHLYLLNGKNWYGDLGDAAKFLTITREFARFKGGYFFSVDDDLLYPSDYCLYMISKIKKWEYKKVVGLHGKTFKTPVSSFYRDRENISWYHNQRALMNDKPVHMLGTGLMAFPIGLIDIGINDLIQKPRNAADIHIAELCQRQGVGMICVAHRANHVILSPKLDHNLDTIYAASRNNDAVHTRRVNSINWVIY